MGRFRTIPDKAIIHPSVAERMQKFGYNRPNLPPNSLEPLQSLPTTSANVAGFFRYHRPDSPESQTTDASARKSATATAFLVLGGAFLLLRFAAVTLTRRPG